MPERIDPAMKQRFERAGLARVMADVNAGRYSGEALGQASMWIDDEFADIAVQKRASDARYQQSIKRGRRGGIAVPLALGFAVVLTAVWALDL